MRRYKVRVKLSNYATDIDVQASVINVAINRAVEQARRDAKRRTGSTNNDWCEVTARDMGAVKYDWCITKHYPEKSGSGFVQRQAVLDHGPFKTKGEAEEFIKTLPTLQRDPELPSWAGHVGYSTKKIEVPRERT